MSKFGDDGHATEGEKHKKYICSVDCKLYSGSDSTNSYKTPQTA